MNTQQDTLVYNDSLTFPWDELILPCGYPTATVTWRNIKGAPFGPPPTPLPHTDVEDTIPF